MGTRGATHSEGDNKRDMYKEQMLQKRRAKESEREGERKRKKNQSKMKKKKKKI